MKILLSFVVILAFVKFGNAGCPNKEVQPMEWDNFRGTWYEYESFGDAVTRLFYKCVSNQYYTDTDNIWAERNYTLRGLSIKGKEKFKAELVRFGQYELIEQGTILSHKKSMYLLSTDYFNYAILWSCSGSLWTSESSWIYTRVREPSFSPEIENYINGNLTKIGLSRKMYGQIKQDNCVE